MEASLSTFLCCLHSFQRQLNVWLTAELNVWLTAEKNDVSSLSDLSVIDIDTLCKEVVPLTSVLYRSNGGVIDKLPDC